MKTIEKFWDTTRTEDWTDDDGEVRELNRTEIASMTPFANLPEGVEGFSPAMEGSDGQP